jgi:hypothetical protein
MCLVAMAGVSADIVDPVLRPSVIYFSVDSFGGRRAGTKNDSLSSDSTFLFLSPAVLRLHSLPQKSFIAASNQK